MFRVTKNEASNKTVRMPDKLIERLERVAKENGVSFNKVVVQCCEYALENLNRNADGSSSIGGVHTGKD